MGDRSLFVVLLSSMLIARYHPGAGTKGDTPPTMSELISDACALVKLAHELFPED